MALLQIDSERDAVFLDGHRVRLRLVVLAQHDAFLLRDGLVHAEQNALDAEPRVDEGVLDEAEPPEHGQAEQLDRDIVAEPIRDQARQAVALGVNQPVGIADPVQLQHVATKRDGADDPAPDEVVGRHLRLPGEDPQQDLRSTVVERPAEEFAVDVLDGDQVPIGGLAVDPVHHLLIEKRVVMVAPQVGHGNPRGNGDVGHSKNGSRDGLALAPLPPIASVPSIKRPPSAAMFVMHS